MDNWFEHVQLLKLKSVHFRGWKDGYSKEKVTYVNIISREPSVNRKDLKVLTSEESRWNNPVLNPLAVLHLRNKLYLSCFPI